MLKAVLITLGALFLLFAIAGGIVFGARSLPVPVSYIEQQDCQSRAKAEHTQHPSCPKTETVWERGLTDPVAFYTLWLTLFTLALAVGAAFQSGLIFNQISLARDEFNATHRPEIVIHSVQFDVPGSGTFNTGPIQSVGATVSYFNKGSTDATILEARGYILALETPLAVDLEFPIVTPNRHIIASGEEGWVNLVSKIERNTAKISVRDSAANIFCVGTIIYADGRGARRTTGFCRRLDYGARWERWVYVEEKGYGYEYAY